MSNTRISAFLDREREFDLRPKLEELERFAGAGTGLIVKRVIAGDFYALDCPTIVRLALIGAGETPQDAANLATDYVATRPLTEGHALATQIVMALWHGVAPKSEPEPKPAPGDNELILDADGAEPVRVNDDGTMTAMCRLPDDGGFVPAEAA